VSITDSKLMMSIQAVDAEASRLVARVNGDLDEPLPDDHELLMAFDAAAAKLKTLYERARKEEPALPVYESLVNG